MEENWKNSILDVIETRSSQLKKDGNDIYCLDFEKNSGVKFHDMMKGGSTLRRKVSDILHQSNWETDHYWRFISSSIEGYCEKHNKSEIVVADFGCGDGRFTQLLLDQGFKKILALDTSYDSLAALSQFVQEEGLSDNVLILHGGIDDIPLHSDSIDFALCIGVLYYLGDNHSKGVNELTRVIKAEGHLISSEPNLEGLLLRSAVFNDLDDFLQGIDDQTVRESADPNATRFKIQSQEKVQETYNAAGLSVTSSHKISVFEQLLRIRLVRGDISEEDVKGKINDLKIAFDKLDNEGEFAKTILYDSIKK